MIGRVKEHIKIYDVLSLESERRRVWTTLKLDVVEGGGCLQNGKRCSGRSSHTMTTIYQIPSFRLLDATVRVARSAQALAIALTALVFPAANFRPYTYWPLVLAACTITQHISSIFIFLTTFARLYDESWDPRLLVWISVYMFLFGFVIWEFLECYVFGYKVEKEQSKCVLCNVFVRSVSLC